jgi:hypothetical protein
MNSLDNRPVELGTAASAAVPQLRGKHHRRSKKAKPSIWVASLAICALAVSSFTATTASSDPIYTCPTGFELKDYFSEPLYCDKLIQEDTAFTVPEGVTQISVMAFGGGGAGGGGGETAGIPKAGGGGGAGEITQASLEVVGGEVLTITVGAGGSRGTVNAITGVATNGGDGSATTVRDSANTVRVSAVGGKGGKSGTNGGDGGASGNSTPADINPGGTGFNSNGRSSGGGGGGFSTAGVNGALLVGGNGGQGNLIGDFGFPFSTNTQMSWSSIVVDEYPGLKNLFIDDLGHGGGGAVVILSEDTPAGTNGESHPGENAGQAAGHVTGSGGHWAGSSNSQAQAFPGQGGSGGAGVDAATDFGDFGSDGVAGAVWLRVLAIEDGGGGGGGGGTFAGTYFSFTTDRLDFGGSIGINSDATGDLWLGLWVDDVYFGPSPLEEGGLPSTFDWDYFAQLATCEDQVFEFALYGTDVDPGFEFAPEFPIPALEDAIGYDSFTLGGDPELCNSCGGVAYVNQTGGVNGSDGLKLDFEDGSFRVGRNGMSQTYDADNDENGLLDAGELTYNGVLLAISSDTTRTVFRTPRYDNAETFPALIPIDCETSTLSVGRVFYADLDSSSDFDANSDVKFTLTYDYILGDEHFSVSYMVERPSTSTMSIQLYHSIDMLLDGNDLGPASTGTGLSQIFPGRFVVQRGAQTVGGFAQKNQDVFSSYWAGNYSDITNLALHVPLPNTVTNDEQTDVGVGIHFDLGTATASVSRSSFVIFSSLANVSLSGPSTGGDYTPPAPAETKLDPCKAVASSETVSKKEKAFSGFAINSAVLTKAMKKEIRSFLRKHPKEVCVSVAGFTMGPTVLSTDPKLAADRARAVRAYIKSLRPEAVFTEIQWGTEKSVGANVRRAKVTLRF